MEAKTLRYKKGDLFKTLSGRYWMVLYIVKLKDRRREESWFDAAGIKYHCMEWRFVDDTWTPASQLSLPISAVETLTKRISRLSLLLKTGKPLRYDP